MSTPAEVLETLLKLGVTVHDAFVSAKAKDGSIDWTKFLKSQGYTDIVTQVQGLIAQLTTGDIDAAVAAIDVKRTALLNGRDVGDLSVDELHQYSALLDARSLLVNKELKNFGATSGFFQWLVETGLPTLLKVAKIVIGLL